MDINLFIILLICVPFSTIHCTPVFFWKTVINAKPVFPQIKKEEFLDEFKQITDVGMTVAFTYPKISIKDFQCVSCFPHLSKQEPTYFYADVETPIAALKSYYNTSEKLSVDHDGILATSMNCLDKYLYIISLENLRASSNPLKSCDYAIKTIENQFNCSKAHYLFMGTIDASKTIEPPGQLCQTKNISVFLSEIELYESSIKSAQKYQIKDIIVQKNIDNQLEVELPTDDENATLSFSLHIENKYIELKYFLFKNSDYRVTELYAPQANSYSCAKLVLQKDEQKLVLKKFQIQYGKSQEATHFHFNNAWTCEGFTSPAIISGVFVTAILVGILSVGISMLLNIQTPSKFDPTEGPYITINATG